MYRQIDSNKRKTWLLMFSVLTLAALVGLMLGWAMGMALTLVLIALGLAAGMNLFAYYRSDRIVLSTTGAKEIRREANPELYRLVENLCIAAGLPMPRLCLIDDKAVNALATGRDPQHAAVVLTQGLLDKLEKPEVEGVIAHELSHIKNHYTRLMSILVVLVGWAAVLSDRFRRGQGSKDPSLPLLGLVLVGTAKVIGLAASRNMDFIADAEAALMTRAPDAIAGALERILYDPEMLETAARATAHLYFVDPLKFQWEEGLSATHPPIEERVAALRGMGI